ncbi:MAG: HPF/RaiA family ribosome-associated protein [Myxococcota bacterium]
MEIHWRNGDGIPGKEKEKIEARLRALAETHRDLIDIRINIKRSGHHRRGGQEVVIACQARGKEIVATREQPEAAVALNEAVDVLERQVVKLRDRRRTRRAERPAEPPRLGIVDSVNREEGYGFIRTDGGDKVYFHRVRPAGGRRARRPERRSGPGGSPGDNRGPCAAGSAGALTGLRCRQGDGRRIAPMTPRVMLPGALSMRAANGSAG